MNREHVIHSGHEYRAYAHSGMPAYLENIMLLYNNYNNDYIYYNASVDREGGFPSLAWRSLRVPPVKNV